MISKLGAGTLSFARGIGAVALVAARTVHRVPTLSGREFLRAWVRFGWDSLPLTLVVAVLTGITVVVQTTIFVQHFGVRAFVGWAGGYAVLWEFGPLLLGLMLAARSGARNAAELALLQVGGQIEGLRGVALDPYALLVAPRVLALTLSVTSLAGVAFLVSILFECATARWTLGLPLNVFFDNFAELLSARDLLGGMTKATVFGADIALVSTTVGLAARGGARAVGRAAASAVVLSSASIFALDLVLTTLFARAFG